MEIETKKSKYSVLSDLSIVVNNEIARNFSNIKRTKIDEEEVIRSLKRELSDEELVANLSFCTNMGLGITEDCNFRCKYCIYSGKYSSERTHSTKKMSFNTAQKAVDMFLKNLMVRNRANKRRNVYIVFFGGECLLEFGLLKRIVQYAEISLLKTGLSGKFDLKLRMTTNGYLLGNDDIIDYLAEKEVLVDLSLDGPEEEHDKFRVTVNGGKTWTKIIENILKIKNRYPDYYDNNVRILVTMHPHHNGKSIDRYFLNNPSLFKKDQYTFNKVNLTGLDEDIVRELEKTSGPKSNRQLEQMYQELDGKIRYKKRSSGSTFTATCFPGAARIFVDVDGNINICEKMSNTAPNIGNVFNGFDFDSIRHIIWKYNEEIIQNKCWECECWFLCNICFAKAFRDGEVKFDCSIRDYYLELLKGFLEQKEKEDEKGNGSDYNNIPDFLDSL